MARATFPGWIARPSSAVSVPSSLFSTAEQLRCCFREWRISATLALTCHACLTEVANVLYYVGDTESRIIDGYS